MSTPRQKVVLDGADRGEAVKGLRRALRVLLKVWNSPEPMTVSQISREFHTSKPTASRVLKTLKEERFLVSNGRGYSVGPAVTSLLGWANAKQLLVDVLRPELQMLATRTDETSALFLHYGSVRFCVHQEHGNEEVQHVLELGALRPLFIGASGIAIVSELPDERLAPLRRAVEAGKPLLGYPPPPLDRFLEALAESRRHGYAISTDGTVNGVSGVGTAIVGEAGVLGSVVITGPSSRLPRELLAALGELLKSRRAQWHELLAWSEILGRDGDESNS